jgi:sulfur carrier protein
VPPEITAREAARSRSGPGLAIRVNGRARRVASGSSVADLLERLALERRRVAVAINREVVPRSAHANRILAEGDRVEILEAVGGG